MNEYIQEKIKTLRELGIQLSRTQREHIKGLKTEIQVDNYAHDLIFGVDAIDAISCAPKPSRYLQSFGRRKVLI